MSAHAHAVFPLLVTLAPAAQAAPMDAALARPVPEARGDKPAMMSSALMPWLG
jgi:hypothetical protein